MKNCSEQWATLFHVSLSIGSGYAPCSLATSRDDCFVLFNSLPPAPPRGGFGHVVVVYFEVLSMGVYGFDDGGLLVIFYIKKKGSLMVCMVVFAEGLFVRLEVKRKYYYCSFLPLHQLNAKRLKNDERRRRNFWVGSNSAQAAYDWKRRRRLGLSSRKSSLLSTNVEEARVRIKSSMKILGMSVLMVFLPAGKLLRSSR